MRELNLALWGPSAAGKTALLSQLYERPHRDWEIFPTRESLPFIERLQPVVQAGNHFPPATTDLSEKIVYLLRNKRSGATATLQVEDRAGRDFEGISEESQSRLASADGLVLLFDPLRDEQLLWSEVKKTFQRLQVASGRGAEKDPRPIAVCLSKADLVIHTLEDLRRAREEPDAFVRERLAPRLASEIERLCSNYRLFPVSAAGVRARRGVIEPLIFYDELLRFRLGHGGSPVNLIEPFLWVFGELEKSA